MQATPTSQNLAEDSTSLDSQSGPAAFFIGMEGVPDWPPVTVSDRVAAWYKAVPPFVLAFPAMAAVGLGTSLRRLQKLEWKPFVVGLVAAVLVGCASIVMVKLMTPLLG